MTWILIIVPAPPRSTARLRGRCLSVGLAGPAARSGTGVYRRGMAKEPAVQVGENLWRLRLLGDYVNAYAVRSPDGQVTLVDTGVKSSAKRLSQALEHIRVEPQDRLHLTG